MPSFLGEYRHTIDTKGRLIVPARLRPALAGDEVVLTRWLEKSVAMWSQEGWGEIEATLRAQAGTSAGSRAFVRLVAASAHADQIDKQGRISVPQHLREHAGIDKEVVVIGAVTRAELWDPQRWAELKQTGDDSLEELAAQMEL